MPNAINIADVMPSAQRVRKPLSDGRIREYTYAWRGGPRIQTLTAKSDQLLAVERSRRFPETLERYKKATTPSEDKRSLWGLITKYLTSPEFKRLAPRTATDRRKHLDKVRADLGRMELSALSATKARMKLIEWRDKFQSTPKTADELLGALAIVLSWAHDRGIIGVNPLVRFPRIYRCNRADMVWTDEDLAALKPHCSPELWNAIQLAVLTGIRMGDLIKLTWNCVGENAVKLQTSKSNKKTTAVVPLLPETQELLDRIHRGKSDTILNNSKNNPWTESGLNTAFQKAKKAAGIEHLRFHDLRGTAATRFVGAGLNDAEVATILGWNTSKVDQIKKRYVSAQAIGKALGEKMKRLVASTV